MKEILSTLNHDELIQTLQLEMAPDSSYVLVENGLVGKDDAINMYFNPNNINAVKERLKAAGYYHNKNKRHLLGKQGDEMHIIPIPDILYIEGINNDTYLYTAKGSYRTKDKLYELETSLHQYKFIRISKSYIINMYHIQKIKPTFGGKLVLQLPDHILLDVTRHYVQAFKQMLGM